METNEIKNLIEVGFNKPKLFKRSIWNKAVKIMDFLVEVTNGEVTQKDMGPGLEKYSASNIEDRIPLWTLLYKRHIGGTITVDDAAPELEMIAQEMGLKRNHGRVSMEYFRRHPEEL